MGSINYSYQKEWIRVAQRLSVLLEAVVGDHPESYGCPEANEVREYKEFGQPFWWFMRIQKMIDTLAHHLDADFETKWETAREAYYRNREVREA